MQGGDAAGIARVFATAHADSLTEQQEYIVLEDAGHGSINELTLHSNRRPPFTDQSPIPPHLGYQLAGIGTYALAGQYCLQKCQHFQRHAAEGHRPRHLRMAATHLFPKNGHPSQISI